MSRHALRGLCVEREVEKSSALQSTKLTPAALKELESAVARAVQNQDNVGRAIIEQKSFNCQPDIGARLLNLNISGRRLLFQPSEAEEIGDVGPIPRSVG